MYETLSEIAHSISVNIQKPSLLEFSYLLYGVCPDLPRYRNGLCILDEVRGQKSPGVLDRQLHELAEELLLSPLLQIESLIFIEN